MHPLLRNKKISLKYEVLETLLAGIVLAGYEVKSLKSGFGSLEGSYIMIKQELGKAKVIIRGLSIPPYQANNQSVTYLPERDRLLLLHKKEIATLEQALHTKGVTLVPKTVGLLRGRVKVELALVRGKKKYDKRQDIKKRDQKRDVQRESKASFK